jgi:alkanesulfonate monooxygenase SsuD/methylene tetrahydromethanopterin reductase-like flavin-dependent oxidoreductase (luciferase family)
LTVLQLAIQTPPEHTTFSALRDVWQAADELGFRAAFTFDHLVPLNPGERPGSDESGSQRRGPQLEGWVALAALAASTRHIQVGTLVSAITMRHPALVAKMAVTLDHATEGRAILGLGAAWHEVEHRMFAIPFPPVGERMGRLDEALTMFKRLTSTTGPVDFDGRWYQLSGAVSEPLPVRQEGIPILVGGSGARLKRIAVRHADLFNGFAAPWDWPAVNAELDQLLAVAGRPPGSLERTAFVFGELSGEPSREQALIARFQRTRGGSDDEVRRRVVFVDPAQALAVLRTYEAAGITLAIVNLRSPFSIAGLERLATEVLPTLAS